MIITMHHSMTAAITHSRTERLYDEHVYDEMFNNRYYQSFHGSSANNRNSNEKTTARSTLTSVLSNKITERRSSATNRGCRNISATAGLLHETRRSNSTSCLDSPNDKTVPKLPKENNPCLASPYAISRQRQVSEAIPTMYEDTNDVRSSALRQRSISASSSALFKSDKRQLSTASRFNGSSLNSLNSSAKNTPSKGNKVADLRNKFDSISEKAKKEEIRISKKGSALQKSSTEVTVSKLLSKNSPSPLKSSYVRNSGVLKSSTVPNCPAAAKVVAPKDCKVSSVKKVVQNFERSISDTSAGDMKALSKSNNDLLSVKNTDSFDRANKKYSSIPLNVSSKPPANLKSSQTSHLHSAIKSSPPSKPASLTSPSANKTATIKKSMPLKNSSALHQTTSSASKTTNVDTFKKPTLPKQRKLIARNDISRAKLGKAPDPPKACAQPKVPVPQPRKCKVEKRDHLYLNKEHTKELVTKKESTSEQNNLEKSKSLPNTSFLWKYRESVSSSTENLDSPTVNCNAGSPSNGGDYFEDPYTYDDDIMEYASTSLLVDDEPIYMEANFVSKDSTEQHEVNGVYASTDVTKLINENFKDSGESDEGWVDLSENEHEKANCNVSPNKLKLRKKNGSKKNCSMKRLSWSQSFQKLNKQSEMSPTDDYNSINDYDMNDKTSVSSSCADSMDHQYEALYDIINQSSIVSDVTQPLCNSRDSIPQLPIRDHSPLPKMKDKAISKDSGIGEYRSQTIDASCLDDDDAPDNAGIAKIAGDKIKKIKRNWSLTKSDIRLELSSRWNRMKPKKTSKSAAEIGVNVENENYKSTDSKGFAMPSYISPLMSPSSPTKETAQFYLPCTERVEDSTTKTERPKSESFTLDSNDMANLNNRRISLGKVTRPTVLPPLPPSACRSSTSSSSVNSDKSSVYDSIWMNPLHNAHLETSQKSRKTELSIDLSGTPNELGIPVAKMPPKSPVDEEPLYQFYQENMRQRSSQWNNASDGSGSSDSGPVSSNDKMLDSRAEPAGLQEKRKTFDLLSTETKMQTLWKDIPEVKASGLLDALSSQEKKMQEAIFEIMTSEASYLKSLDILVNHFMSCPEFTDEFSTECVLSRHERHVLFSDILPVYEVSERLLAAFEKHWQEDLRLSSICDILYEHATKYFSVYVKYCSNQIYQDRQYKQLKESKPEFMEVVKKLESSTVCQNLTLHSFLMLPMQRITRLPLLVDAVYHRLESHTFLYESSKNTLGCLNKIVADCNEGARKMERMEEMLRLSQQIDFKDCKSIPLISSNRWLVKKGDISRLSFSEASAKLTFSKATKCTKTNVYLFLFTDLLIITKRKGDGSFGVLDYCPRNMVQVSAINDENTVKLPCRPPDGATNLFQFTMLQNHEGKTVELIFCCQLESDRMRWMEAVTPPMSENPDEKIYEEWDCPQMQVIHSYQAQQPDELTLEESDVVNVFRKMADGWYQGERIRDGIQGWFPGNHAEEIVSSHVRARNLRQRYRLLALSHSYLLQAQKSRSK